MVVPHQTGYIYYSEPTMKSKYYLFSHFKCILSTLFTVTFGGNFRKLPNFACVFNVISPNLKRWISGFKRVFRGFHVKKEEKMVLPLPLKNASFWNPRDFSIMKTLFTSGKRRCICGFFKYENNISNKILDDLRGLLSEKMWWICFSSFPRHMHLV